MLKKVNQEIICHLPTIAWTLAGCLAVVAGMPWVLWASYALAAQ